MNPTLTQAPAPAPPDVAEALRGAPAYTIVIHHHRPATHAAATATAYLRTTRGWEGRFGPALDTATLTRLGADAEKVTIVPPHPGSDPWAPGAWAVTTPTGNRPCQTREEATWRAFNLNTARPAPPTPSQVLHQADRATLWGPVTDPRLSQELT